MVRERHPSPTECFEFDWYRRVSGPGFRWKSDPKYGLLLVGPPNELLQPYEPLMESTGLFLTFAHLEGSEDSLLQFANEYGRLGTYHHYHPEDSEPFTEWQAHHRWMKFLAEVRHQLRKERPQCGKFVRWENDDVVFSFPAITTWGSGDWRHPGQFRKRLLSTTGSLLFKTGDVRGPAHWFLAFAIEEWLRTMENFRKPIATHMIWSEKLKQPRLVLSPNNLLGAMVCQFAAALHGSWRFQECELCHKFFRLAPGVNRANRRTCSITCKQYLHNRRVQDARALYAQGQSIRDIAKALEVKPRAGRSGVDIVRNWIDKT